MEKCMICGCIEYNACVLPIPGKEPVGDTCSWHSRNLCSYCADPALFVQAVRPYTNHRCLSIHQHPPQITPYTLRVALKQLGLNVIVSEKYARGIGRHAVHLKAIHSQAEDELFRAVIKAWFPNYEQMHPTANFFHINLEESKPQLEAAETPITND